MAGTICALDVETTGFVPGLHEILEVCAVRIDMETGAIEDEFASLVRSIGPIANSHIHGITPSMVAGAPSPGAVMRGLARFIRGARVAGYSRNGFDSRFVNACAERTLGAQIISREMNVLAATRRLLPDLENHRLGTVARALGIRNPQAHSAQGDARTLARVILALGIGVPSRERRSSARPALSAASACPATARRLDAARTRP